MSVTENNRGLKLVSGIVFVLLVGAPTLQARETGHGPDRPNILFVVTDDQAPWAMGCAVSDTGNGNVPAAVKPNNTLRTAAAKPTARPFSTRTRVRDCIRCTSRVIMRLPGLATPVLVQGSQMGFPRRHRAAAVAALGRCDRARHGHGLPAQLPRVFLGR